MLAPTRYSLSRLLKECELFSEKYLLSFNANKSNYIVFPHVGDNVSTNITFMNNQIASSDSSIHLGNVIGPNISTKRVEVSIADFNRKINVLLSTFTMLAPIVYIKYLYQYVCHYMAVSYGMYATDTPTIFL